MTREVKPQVLWGWKRDKVINGIRYPESRTMYFSADLKGNKIKRAYFFLESRAKESEIGLLIKKLERLSRKGRESRSSFAKATADKLGRYDLKVNVGKDHLHKGYVRFRMEIGSPTKFDKQTIARRLKGKPRLKIDPPQIISASVDYNINQYVPFALYVGSGLSSESGLPLLGEIHKLFEVDNEKDKLVFGDMDRLPERLISDIDKEFKKFCQFTIAAEKAQPSKSHKLLAQLFRKGLIRQVLTDNLDNLFFKVNMPFVQTRLSIFPDRFPVDFKRDIKSLLVIGISVDRRDVIKQARKQGLKIIVINPLLPVAPYSRNMDYLHKEDIFYKDKAKEVLPKICQHLFKLSKQKPKILLTGGTGFIGSHTARAFKQVGYQVDLFKGDVTKLSDWKKNLINQQIIFHLAGIRTEAKKDYLVNAKSVEYMFTAIKSIKNSVNKIILASSQAVYLGNQPPFKETTQPIPTTIYGKSKLQAERLAQKLATKSNIDLVILRYATTIGLGARKQSNMSGPLVHWVKAGIKGKPIKVFQDGKQTREYTHIKDIVSANILAVEIIKSGIFNVGGSIEIKLIDLAKWVRNETGKKSVIDIVGGKPISSDPSRVISSINKLKKYGWKPKFTAKQAVREYVKSLIQDL